ncbi:MAG TPA: hypothetical protein VKM54_02055 [Myxococcota bacterium]|nr:hypothetical protein [Myxococcota bacterium]
MTPKIETTPNPSTDIATIPRLVEALRASFDAGTTRPASWRKDQLDYVLVHESREAELLDALKRCLREFYGADPKRSADFGRIVNEHHRRLAVLLKDGEIVVGGEVDESDRRHLANSNLPFGGVGPSGMSAYHGRGSFETFRHRKSVVTKSTRLDPKIAYPPHTRLKTQILKRLM